MTQTPVENNQTGLSHDTGLLVDLREIMASDLHAEDKLNDIVKLTAAHLDADVCSIYLMRSGDVLELFATHGLKQEAVHTTRLELGEGLIGSAAQHGSPVNVANAEREAGFASRPETGEKAFKGFCAVPILRDHKARGVLAVQSVQEAQLPQEKVAILQTIAMVIAELAMSGDLISRGELTLLSKPFKKPTQLGGQTFSPGLVIEQAVVHKVKPTIKKVIADDVKTEKERLKKALADVDRSIEKLLKSMNSDMAIEMRDMLESYQMFAQDKNWQDQIMGMIDQGLTADAAIQRAQSEIRQRFENIDAPILKEKADDIEDISNRLISKMNENDNQESAAPKKFILVARSLSAAALFDYGLDKIKGIILSEGSPSGHIAIIAKSLDIPVLGQCRDAPRYIRTGDQLILDTNNHTVYINPSDYLSELYAARIERQHKRQKRYRSVREKPSVTKDDQHISLLMNAGLSVEMPLLQETGADGIGLFRTEISFMGRSRYPRVVEQAAFYKSIMDQADGKPVTFRTVDIGGDKPLPYFKAPDEENPALGWRAMRIIMDRPAVLRTQIRALIIGAEGRPLRVMLPFVSDISELDHAKKLIAMEFKRAQDRGTPLPQRFDLGIMIEVPSLLWQLDEVFKRIDFAAVGTNDLKQYLFAADYRSDALQDRYDVLSLSMVRALKTIADKAKQHNKDVSICGEMAGKPLEAMVLIAIGFKALSMPVASIGAVKDMVRSLDASQTLNYIEFLLKNGTPSLRKKLQSFAKDHKIKV